MSRGTTRSSQRKPARSPARAAARCPGRATAADRRVVARLRAGDPEAFAQIYRRWYEPMRRLAATYVQCEAQDIVQEVFLTLWRGRASLRVREALGAYLLAAVRHRAIDVKARLKREQRFPQWLERRSRGRCHEYFDAFSMKIPAVERAEAERHSYNGGEVELLREELERVIQVMVRDLPPRCRAVYQVARELEREGGVLYANVGARLGISSATVRLQLIKAWDRLHAPLIEAGWPNALRRQATSSGGRR
jgi:RNA polymerase sigma factor (sigma-70 family)